MVDHFQSFRCFRGRTCSTPLRSALVAFLLATLSSGFPLVAQDAGSGSTVVVLRDGQSVRDVAQEYLGDANLWPEILKASDISSPREVRTGTRLVVPLTVISRANQSIEAARIAIQEATDAGARLFAPELVNQAIRLHELSLQQRKARSWAEARSSGEQASAAARNALAVARSERNVSAEAIVSDLIGTVQGRLPQDLVWHARGLRSSLVEEEKVRTLSNSFAEIMFRDESRLRLNANSQAVIQQMRVDLLSKRQVANVSLVEGDVYALLGANRARKSFELEVSGVETQIDSRNFWVGKQGNESRFANYDDAEVYVSSGGERVSLGKNQGTLVRMLQAPTAPRVLLPITELKAPDDDQIVYRKEVTLEWDPVEGAVSYWLEIGADPVYFNTFINRWGVEGTKLSIDELEDGTFYWRVAAIDDQNFPGAKSKVRRFTLKNTERPPFLVVSAPDDASYVRRPMVTVVGESETIATVFVNNVAVTMNDGGAFSSTIALQEGLNNIEIKAIDEKGAQTVLRRGVTFLPDKEAEVSLDLGLEEIAPKTYLTAANGITVSGTTSASSQVQVSSPNTTAATYSNDEGGFRVSVPLKTQREKFDLQVTSPSGFASADSFIVVSDASAPKLILDSLPPATTSTQTVDVSGLVVDGETLLLNGRSVPLREGRFEVTVELTAGSNRISLMATDRAGNRAAGAFDVVLDREPPALQGYAFTETQVSGGETVALEVRASDISAIQRAAPYGVRVGAWTYESILRFRPSTATFYGTLVVPVDVSGRLVLEFLELEDYYGNGRRYTSP